MCSRHAALKKKKSLSEEVRSQKSPLLYTVTKEKENQMVMCRAGFTSNPWLVATKNHHFLMVFLTVFH